MIPNKKLLVAAAVLGACAAANAATITARSGFGDLSGGFSSCKDGDNVAAFATGNVLDASHITLGCVGWFSVDIDTTAQTITLTGRQHGNYESGFLEITGITELTITSLSTVSHAGLFDPDYYGSPSLYGAVPTPQLSFTGSSLRIAFSAFGASPPQFTYDGDGGTAVFAYNTTPVPEPETYAMMLAGLGVLGGLARRRKP